jgi:hypothetical protein
MTWNLLALVVAMWHIIQKMKARIIAICAERILPPLLQKQRQYIVILDVKYSSSFFARRYGNIHHLCLPSFDIGHIFRSCNSLLNLDGLYHNLSNKETRLF